jgi:hypothetical protein
MEVEGLIGGSWPPSQGVLEQLLEEANWTSRPVGGGFEVRVEYFDSC